MLKSTPIKHRNKKNHRNSSIKSRYVCISLKQMRTNMNVWRKKSKISCEQIYDDLKQKITKKQKVNLQKCRELSNWNLNYLGFRIQQIKKKNRTFISH